MSDDLVARLRSADLRDAAHAAQHAADEITRLRTDLAADREAHKKTHDMMNEVIIENTALHEAANWPDKSPAVIRTDLAAARELLKEARDTLGARQRGIHSDGPLLARIDAALKGEA